LTIAHDKLYLLLAPTQLSEFAIRILMEKIILKIIIQSLLMSLTLY